MMAGQNTIQATQTGEADVFRPHSSDIPAPPLTESEARERRLYAITPELEHHVEVEWNTLDQWVAFKMTPHFVEQLYKGEPLDIDPAVVQSQYIIPEYRTAQMQYFSESAYIVGTQLPQLDRKIAQYTAEAKDLSEAAGYNLHRIEQGDLNPQLQLNADSWEGQAKEKRKLVKDLKEDIPKAKMNAKVKDAMFYKIDGFISHVEQGECADEVDAIIFAGKKRAFEQVISNLKADQAVLDDETEEDAEIIRGYNRKIELLEVELKALEDAHSAPAAQPLEANSSSRKETAQGTHEAKEQPGLLRDLRRLLIGSFSSRAAALYGASHR